MGIIANVNNGGQSLPSAKKSFRDTKKWLSEEFYQALNRHMTNDEGVSVTYAQQMISGVVDMATNPEKDDYVRLAATKFITEHLEGKAGTMTEDKHEEMPKLVICVQGTSPDELKHISEQFEDAEPKEDVVVEISNEDGSDQETYLV